MREHWHWRYFAFILFSCRLKSKYLKNKDRNDQNEWFDDDSKSSVFFNSSIALCSWFNSDGSESVPAWAGQLKVMSVVYQNEKCHSRFLIRYVRVVQLWQRNCDSIWLWWWWLLLLDHFLYLCEIWLILLKLWLQWVIKLMTVETEFDLLMKHWDWWHWWRWIKWILHLNFMYLYFKLSWTAMSSVFDCVMSESASSISTNSCSMLFASIINNKRIQVKT